MCLKKLDRLDKHVYGDFIIDAIGRLPYVYKVNINDCIRLSHECQRCGHKYINE